MRIFQDSLCNTTEKKPRHARMLAPTNNDQSNTHLIDKMQNLIGRHTGTMVTHMSDMCRKQWLRHGKDLLCLLCSWTYNTCRKPWYISLIRTLVKWRYIEKIKGGLHHKRKFSCQMNSTQCLLCSIYGNQNTPIPGICHDAPPFCSVWKASTSILYLCSL